MTAMIWTDVGENSPEAFWASSWPRKEQVWTARAHRLATNDLQYRAPRRTRFVYNIWLLNKARWTIFLILVYSPYRLSWTRDFAISVRSAGIRAWKPLHVRAHCTLLFSRVLYYSYSFETHQKTSRYIGQYRWICKVFI